MSPQGNYLLTLNGRKLPATLENVDASSNQMAHMPDFSAMLNLTVLDMSFNLITVLNAHKLPASLRELDLKWNTILSLPSLAALIHLEKLDLLHNRLHVLHQLPASLLYIDLQQNNLTKFFDASGLTALEHLNLAENHIVDSDSAVFPTSLLDLLLTNNLLTRVPAPVTNLSQLRQLSIGSNQITSIDDFVFPSSLTNLHVSNTSLLTLSLIKFHNDVSSLQKASFFLNPLYQISDDAFTHLTNLTRIELDMCNLTRLPTALKSCPHVQSVNLLNNPAIICTCLEASPLLPLYSRQNPVDMYGYCNGNLAINTFMKTLAKDCLPPASRTFR